MAKNVRLEDLMGDDEPAKSTSRRLEAVDTEADESLVKLTIELPASLHRTLKSFALMKADDASLAEIIRAAVSVMDANERVGKAVAKEAAKLKSQRRRGPAPRR